VVQACRHLEISRTKHSPKKATRKRGGLSHGAIDLVGGIIVTRKGRGMKTAFWLAGATVLALAAPAMAADSIKIGFVSTFSGPTAVIGNDMRNSFELALDHMGRKMAGKPVEVIYEDDGQKPDIGKQKTEKLVQSDHVDFIAGYI
jgi:ABC-type branched-subunit amino acid transport system substrate-binding protein